MYYKKIFVSIFAVVTLLVSAAPALAHVVVKPKEVGVAAFQTFTVGVPVEKEIPTTELRLVIPDGLSHVTPNVKPGWELEVTKRGEGEGEEAIVTEIKWTGGSIPAGQRDDFLFSAQVPSKEGTLFWKAYQTYESGEVVSWDASPQTVEEYENKNHDSHDVADAPKPYSTTNLVNDLSNATGASDNKPMIKDAVKKDNLSMIISIAAIIISCLALFLVTQKKK